jgi:transposase-like protein
MEPIKRIKRSEAAWRELFERQAASGASVQEFCRSEGINPGVFRRWRSALSSKIKKTKRTAAVSKVAAPFIDIGAVDSSRSRFEVRLELGGGVILNIGRG